MLSHSTGFCVLGNPLVTDRWIPLKNGYWRGVLIWYISTVAWTSCWIEFQYAGDLKRHEHHFDQYFCSALLGLRTTWPQIVVSRLALGTIHLYHPHSRENPFHILPTTSPTSSTSRSSNAIRYTLFETIKLQLEWNSWVFDLATSLEHCL